MHGRSGHRDDAGSALIVTLMLVMLLSTLGAGLLLMSQVETLVAANYRVALQALYAAEAGVELASADLQRFDDWSPVLAGGVGAGAGFEPGGRPPPGWDLESLHRLTAAVQGESDDVHGAGPNRPIWRLFGHVAVSGLLADDWLPAPGLVVVWIADDAADADGDPFADSNGVVVIRAEGLGEAGGRRAIEATIRRDGPEVPSVEGESEESEFVPPAVRIVTWRELR